jgi:hypothetical protein
MKRRAWFAAAGVLIAATARAAEPAAPPSGGYVNATYGLAFQPPAFDALPADTAQDVVRFFGPASDGFSPNVVIRIAQSKFAMPVEDFIQSNVKGLEKTGLKVVAEKASKVEGRDAVRIEGTGLISGRELHLFSQSVLDTNRIIVVTCICGETQLEGLRARFTTCLDSITFAADKPTGSYVNVTYGLALQPPLFDALPAAKMQDIAAFHGPSSGGFSPNVGIRIAQVKVSGGLEDYTKSTIEGTEKAGCKLVAQKVRDVQGRAAVLLEYAGTIAGKSLHFFSYSVLDTDRLIIITCTATDAQFEGLRDRFTACLDSFQFTGAKP